MNATQYLAISVDPIIHVSAELLRHYVCGCSLPRRLADSAGRLASLLVRRPNCSLFSLL